MLLLLCINKNEKQIEAYGHSIERSESKMTKKRGFIIIVTILVILGGITGFLIGRKLRKNGEMDLAQANANQISSEYSNGNQENSEKELSIGYIINGNGNEHKNIVIEINIPKLIGLCFIIGCKP